MTDRVNPTRDGDVSSQKTAAAARFAGGSSEGWVVPASNDPANVATDDPDIDETALNAFAQISSGTSYDITIDPGQGYVGGAWIARDISTTVTLDGSTAGQTVYVGWRIDNSDTVVIGKSGGFNAEDPRMPLYDFDTDGSGVTGVTDRRNRDGYRIASDIVETLTNSDLANSTVTVAGNAVGLGGSTAVDHADLSNVGASDHHAKPEGGTAISFDGTNDEFNLLYANALTIDGNGNLAVNESAIALSNLSGYPVGTGDLDFDTATQTELNDHAGKANAHHIPPTETQSKGIGGGYQTPDSATYAEHIDDDTGSYHIVSAGETATVSFADKGIDGFRVYDYEPARNRDFELRIVRDGNVLDTLTHTVNQATQWTEYTFDNTGYTLEFENLGSDWAEIYEIDGHVDGLQNHTHDI